MRLFLFLDEAAESDEPAFDAALPLDFLLVFFPAVFFFEVFFFDDFFDADFFKADFFFVLVLVFFFAVFLPVLFALFRAVFFFAVFFTFFFAADFLAADFLRVVLPADFFAVFFVFFDAAVLRRVDPAADFFLAAARLAPAFLPAVPVREAAVFFFFVATNWVPCPATRRGQFHNFRVRKGLQRSTGDNSADHNPGIGCRQ